jgi:hypothetical protein
LVTPESGGCLWVQPFVAKEAGVTQQHGLLVTLSSAGTRADLDPPKCLTDLQAPWDVCVYLKPLRIWKGSITTHKLD